MRKIFKFIGIYVLSIFMFGGIYFFWWTVHMDSFIISEQFNLHPFSSNREVLNNMVDMMEYSSESDSLKRQLLAVKSEYRKLDKIADSLTPLIRSVRQLNDSVLWDNVQKYEAAQIPDSLSNPLQVLTEMTDTSATRKDMFGLPPALAVEKFRLEIKVSQIKIKTSEDVLGRLQDFANPSLNGRTLELDSLYNYAKYNRQLQLFLVEGNLNRAVYDLYNKARERLYERMKFLDFLLFSASNASTVTYGDMTPNDTFIRVTLFIQAIVCILLITFLGEAVMSHVRGAKQVSATGTPTTM